MERIPVTHAGSLIRPQELLAFLSAVDHGRASTDSVEYEAALAKAVAYAVRRQVETGVDIIDDGEMGKSTWITYLYERTSGLEARPLVGNFSSILPASRDRQNFPGAYRELDMLEHDATIRIRAEANGPEPEEQQEGPRAPSGAVSWVCTGPMTYDRTAIDRDLVNFKVALEGSGKDISETFMPVVAPASAYWLANEHYKTDEEFVYALADAMRDKYRAIVEAGFILQIDDPGIGTSWDMLKPEPSLADYRKYVTLRIEALNHALAGIQPEKVRYHWCWGSWHGAHVNDIPLEHIIDIALKVKAQTYSFEAANVRHQHEMEVWKETKLTPGTILMPGVISHATNIVEHPELIARRLVDWAGIVGRENVVGGADCGMGGRVHAEIGWTKLAALAEGAALATKTLWH